MKINKQIIEKIRDKAKEYFVGGDSSHDWSHVERVHNLAIKIGKKEKANLNIVEIASYLHDVGRKEETDSKGKICHAEKGVEISKKILSKYNLDEEVVENILHCVLSHRHRNNHNPETIEAKVLFDADKLDGIGAVGIARDFLFAGIYNAPLYTGREKEIYKEAKKYAYTKDDTAVLEYYHKLRYIKDKILTKTAKEFAKERHEYMEDFFKRLDKEIKGLL